MNIRPAVSGLGSFSEALRPGVIALVYFAACSLTLLFPDSAGVIASVWPPGGIALAALLLNPPRRWPALLALFAAGGLLANVTAGHSLVAAGGYMVANLLETTACAWGIARWTRRPVTFSRVQDVLALVGVTILVNAGTAALGAATALFTGGAPFLASYRTWWVSNELGLLLVAPLIIVWARRGWWRQPLRWPRVLEALLLLATGVLVAGLVFGPSGPSLSVVAQPYLVFAVIAWAALRFGPAGTVTVLAALAPVVISCTGAAASAFPLGGHDPTERLLLAQLFLGVAGVTGLLLAAGLTEQAASVDLLRESESSLRALGDNLPNGMVYQVVREPDGTMRFLHVSAGVERLNGLPAATVLRDPARLYAQFIEEDRPMIAAAEQASLATMSVFNIVARTRRGDGEIRWMQLCSAPRRLPDGRVLWDGIQTDITERKNVEQALQESRGRLVLAMDLALIAHWELDVATGIFTFNENFYRLHRTTAAEQGGLQMAAADFARKFIPPEEAAVVAEEINKAVLTTDPDFTRQLEHRFIRADGSTGIMLVRFAIIKDAAGRTIKTYGANQDITESKRAEQALAASEERYRNLTAAAFEGVIITENGRILDVSDQALKLFGCERPEMIGRDATEFVSPETRALVAEAIRAGRESAYEHRLLRKDGSEFHGEARAKMIRVGPRLLRMTAIRDITERKQAEAALEQQRRRLESIVSSASDGIITIDADHHVVVFNPAAERMFGCPAAGVIGQPFERLIPERFRAEQGELLRQFGQSRETTRPLGRSGAIYGRRADGGEFPLEGSMAQTLIGDHQLFTVICRNVTDRLRAEEAKQRLEAQLRQSQKMEAIGTLAGGIAHDFNNILTGIMGNLQLAEMDLPDTHPVAPLLHEAVGASRRARNLISQILTFSQRGEPLLAPASLAGIVQEVLRLLRATLPATIDIRSSLDARCPPVLCDATQLYQVIMNLGVNAAAAMRDRPGRLEVTLAHAVPVPAWRELHPQVESRHTVCLSVRDTGCGMSPQVLEHIFEPFFTTRPPGEGTGLGLAMVHGIMQTHQGAIVVESTEGMGTMFYLYFPEAAPVPAGLADGATAAGPALPDAREAALGKQCVLVVDDEVSVLDVVARLLRRSGLEARTFVQATEALAAFERTPEAFAAVVTDLIMPDISGLELARRVLAVRPGVPVIVTSGNMTGPVTEEARQIGVAHVLAKPYELTELLAQIRAVIRS